MSRLNSMSAPRLLGVVVALHGEAKPLLRHYADLIGARSDPTGLLLEITGMGAGPASAGARRLVKAGVAGLLSWGTAAGLAPELPPGALILPPIVMESDQRQFSADAEWHRRVARLVRRWTDPVIAPLADSGGLLSGPDEKRALYQRTGAGCADMESAAVAAVAAEAGIPFLSVRAIVDPAEGRLPGCVTRAVDTHGQLQLAGLLRSAAVRPGDWLHLVRLARWFEAARRTLMRVALEAKPQLLGFTP